LNTTVADIARDRNVELQLEFASCQVETATRPVASRDELFDEVLRLRRVAAESAEQCGALLLAVGLPPTVPHEFPITDTPRYRHIAERYAMIAEAQGVCGCHVHVAVPDLEHAVQVCNRLRPWLPVLLALSANSAVYRDEDSGYASWRNILWHRWPTAGPPPHLESAAAYHATLQTLQELGAMLDDGMVYWDARPSVRFPTVEVRVADVPATMAETVLHATLVRAAVMTALREIRCGSVEPRVSDEILRAQYWRASREGLQGRTRTALMAFVSDVSPALHALGEYHYVTAELARIFVDGNGAMRQRRAWQRGHDAADVIAAAADATLQ
jgi:glutamate---cysteine ligase / carboxylate-amine ligase